MALKKRVGDPVLDPKADVREIASPPEDEVVELELATYAVYTYGPGRVQYVAGVVYEFSPEDAEVMLALEDNGVPIFQEVEVESPPEELESPPLEEGDGVTGGIGAFGKREKGDKPGPIRKPPSIIG